MATGPEQSVLDNGIRVLTDTMPGLESVSINAAFAVGSCYEDETEHGAAHFLEHMVFQGTSMRSAQQIQDEINRFGGVFNAWTDWDTTCFSVHILNEGIAAGLDVLADVISDPRLDREDVEKERNVILQELSGKNGSWTVLRDGFYEAAFGDQSLARPVIGCEESLEVLDSEALRAFHKRHYVTGNLIVSISGGVEHDHAVELVSRAFANVPVAPKSSRPTAEYFGGEAQFACSCDLGIVMFGYSAPPISERNGTAISVFRNILGEGPTSRLFTELREKRGLVYDASAYTNFHVRHPMMILQAEGHANSVKEMFLVMHDQVHDAAANMTEDEMESAKTSMIASLRMSRDYACERSSGAVFDLNEIGESRSLEHHVNVLKNIDLEFLRSCALKLVATPPTLAAHGPVRHLPKLRHVQSRQAPVKAA